MLQKKAILCWFIWIHRNNVVFHASYINPNRIWYASNNLWRDLARCQIYHINSSKNGQAHDLARCMHDLRQRLGCTRWILLGVAWLLCAQNSCIMCVQWPSSVCINIKKWFTLFGTCVYNFSVLIQALASLYIRIEHGFCVHRSQGVPGESSGSS